MKWLTNLHNDDVTLSEFASQTKYVIETGLPKATEAHTVEELDSMGMVGIYTDGTVKEGF